MSGLVCRPESACATQRVGEDEGAGDALPELLAGREELFPGGQFAGDVGRLVRQSRLLEDGRLVVVGDRAAVDGEAHHRAVLGDVGARVGRRLRLVGEEGVAQRELVQEVAGPPLGGIPADVRVDLRAVRGRPGEPGARLRLQVYEGGARRGRVAHQLVLRVRRFLAVGDQCPVTAVGQGDGDRGVPAVRGAGEREVDALLSGEHRAAVRAVVVVAEDRGQRGAQAVTGGRHGQVRDAARAHAHALGPDLLAGGRRPAQPGQDEVVEEQPGQQDIGPFVTHERISRQNAASVDQDRARLASMWQESSRTEHRND